MINKLIILLLKVSRSTLDWNACLPILFVLILITFPNIWIIIKNFKLTFLFSRYCRLQIKCAVHLTIKVAVAYLFILLLLTLSVFLLEIHCVALPMICFTGYKTFISHYIFHKTGFQMFAKFVPKNQM